MLRSSGVEYSPLRAIRRVTIGAALTYTPICTGTQQRIDFTRIEAGDAEIQIQILQLDHFQPEKIEVSEGSPDPLQAGLFFCHQRAICRMDYTEAAAAPVAYYGLLDASGGRWGPEYCRGIKFAQPSWLQQAILGSCLVAFACVGKDILSPSGSSLAIVSHMCGSAGLFSASGPCSRTSNAGGRGRFLRAAFFVTTAFGQATPNQVRLGQAGCVDPRPKQMETGTSQIRLMSLAIAVVAGNTSDYIYR